MDKILLSVIIPCYNSSKSIEIVVNDVLANLENEYALRIILVNDHSKDNTWEVINTICHVHQNVIGLNLAKNFGQQAARMAAIPYIGGAYVVFMDDDGQHKAVIIRSMLLELQKGYDIVYAHFSEKKESAFRKFGSWVNYKMTEFIIKKPKDAKTSSFFVVRDFVARALQNYSSPSPYIFGYFMQITKNISSVEAEHEERIAGQSGYSFRKLIRLWMDGFVGFSVLPLEISSWCGCISAVVGFIYAVVIITRKILHPEMPAGYASLACLVLFIGGIILLILGLLGEYMGRVLIAMNKVPQFVVRDAVNTEFVEKDEK